MSNRPDSSHASSPVISLALCNSRAGPGQNLQFQQNLARSPVVVIVLVAPSNTLEDPVPMVPSMLRAIGETSPA
jgi:hypothetical protein